MKVKVKDGWQVKHGGKMYTGGSSFDVNDTEGRKLIASGLVTKVKAQSGSKNKAQTSSPNKADEPAGGSDT